MELLTIKGVQSNFLTQIVEMNLPVLRFSTTPHCDAVCSFCHNEGREIGTRGQETEKTPSFLSEDEVKQIAGYFRPYFDEIKFTGGEPTTTSNLANLVRIFADEGYECSMVTNGALFDNSLQLELREAGLRRVNVSLPTLDEAQYVQFFGVDKLPRVLRNLRDMARNYERVKINFMASDATIPSQISNMDSLSSELGITISLIELARASTLALPMSSRVVSYLTRDPGILTREESYERIGRRSVVTTNMGGRWEIDDFRDEGYRERAFDNAVCSSCDKRERCVEGPYALRIGYDGTARPCLIRSDNVLEFKGGYENN